MWHSDEYDDFLSGVLAIVILFPLMAVIPKEFLVAWAIFLITLVIINFLIFICRKLKNNRGN